jgi:hypothetical protein
LKGLNFQAAYACNSGHTGRQVLALDDGSVNAAANFPYACHCGRYRLRDLLVADDVSDRCCEFAAGLQA